MMSSEFSVQCSVYCCLNGICGNLRKSVVLMWTAIFLSLSALANPASKNVIDCPYRPLPADYWNLVRTEPGIWNSCFRPYDPQFAEMLWSDSTLIRAVQLDVTEDAQSVTAISSTCDEAGFTVLVYVAEPKMNALMAEGKSRPSNSLEVYFQAGDADSSEFEPYHQFVCQSVSPVISGIYPWLMEDRTFRNIKGFLSVDVHHQENADVFRIRIPWEPLFDKLPWMNGKKDSFYRFNVIRWASTGGQTWGGNVHQMSNAGYLRFPAFTEAEKTAIMKHLLIQGWDKYNEILKMPRYSLDLLPVNSNMSFVRDEAKWPHTELTLAADRAFRDTVMKPMVEHRTAFGKKIVEFESMPFTEREAFYREAAPLLYNIEYDLQQAWGEWQEDLVFNEKKDYEYKLSFPEQDPPKDFAEALKRNDFKAAEAFADEMIANAGKSIDNVFSRKVIPAFIAKKLSAEEYVEKYYAKYAAWLKESGRSVPFDTEMAYVKYMDEFLLKPRAELRKIADGAIADVLAHPERLNERSRDRNLCKMLATRAALFDREDYEKYRQEAEKLVGTDVQKRIDCYYTSFPDPERVMKDPVLNDVARATVGFSKLTNPNPQGKSISFADQETLLEKVLKDKSLKTEDRVLALENYVAHERTGFPRNWISETPKRYNGVFTVGCVDPVAYKKAVDAQKELISIAAKTAVGTNEVARQTLMKQYIALLDLNYVALKSAEAKTTAAALEKVLPELKPQWELKVTGYLAALAYFDEEYENAYGLFHKFTPTEYKGDGKDRAQKEWWYRIAEPYIRTCIAMKQYDEAYLLQEELTKGMIASWEFWHRARYRNMFAELAKLCKPETIEAVK